MKKSSILVFLVALSVFGRGQSNSLHDTFGLLYQTDPQVAAGPRHGPRKELDSVRRWNEIAMDCGAIDHGTLRQQLGPGRLSRALAIVHIAIFDALNAVLAQYESYTGVQAPKGAVSLDVAVSQAAHDTLAALYSGQAASLDSYLAEDLAAIKNKNASRSWSSPTASFEFRRHRL